MKKFNLCKADPYTKDGKEYPNWQKIGEVVQFDNGNMANAFEQKDKTKTDGGDMSF